MESNDKTSFLKNFYAHFIAVDTDTYRCYISNESERLKFK